MKKKLPAWLVLTIICVVAAGLLAATNLMTKDVIKANANREKMETLGKLLPEAVSFKETDSGVSVGLDADGNPVGYALAATTQGFGGEVETTVAALPDGTISGISVGGSNFAETAGLGARAKEPEFQAQFAGKKAPVALTKDGGEIDALSGATITSRAVIKGVNEAMEGISAEAGFTVESTSTAEHLGENLYAATATGFGGPVKVYLTLDENRTIQDIRIGNSEFNETDGLGKKALESDFQEQFIGKTIPVALDQIDALSGATITTNAVLDAINEINDGLDKGLADAPITEEKQADTSGNENVPEQTEAEKPDADSSDPDRFFRERPDTGTGETQQETAGQETADQTTADPDRFFRERPDTGTGETQQETAGQETADQAAADPDRFFRERPDTGTGETQQETVGQETADQGTADSDRFFRERPDTDTGETQQEIAGQETADQGTSDPSRFFRIRPEFVSNDDAGQQEEASSVSTETSDDSRFFRERPEEEVTQEPETSVEPESGATDPEPLSETPEVSAESLDPARFFRARPEGNTEEEFQKADAGEQDSETTKQEPEAEEPDSTTEKTETTTETQNTDRFFRERPEGKAEEAAQDSGTVEEAPEMTEPEPEEAAQESTTEEQNTDRFFRTRP